MVMNFSKYEVDSKFDPKSPVYDLEQYRLIKEFHSDTLVELGVKDTAEAYLLRHFFDEQEVLRDGFDVTFSKVKWFLHNA